MMNKRGKALLLAVSLLCGSRGIAVTESLSIEENHLQKVISSAQSRYALGQFIDNILGQVSSREFLVLADKVNMSEKTDKALYNAMLKNIRSIKHGMPLFNQLKALRAQKKILAKQARELLHDKAEVDACVEIGTSGTYISAIKHYVTVNGPIYVMNDKKRFTDLVEGFSVNPLNYFLSYNYFVPLNDYAKFNEQDIPSKSIDLVVCFTGLHHIPVARIDDFIESIYRILKPRGVFLLLEHDAYADDVLSIVHAAHTVYTMVTNEESYESEQEKSNHRNFRELGYWIAKIESAGFKAGSLRLTQKGDPTLNTMVRFTKKA